MAYAQELRMIAAEAERCEKAIGRLAFCFDEYLHHAVHSLDTDNLTPAEATAHLCNAICAVVGLPESY